MSTFLLPSSYYNNVVPSGYITVYFVTNMLPDFSGLLSPHVINNLNEFPVDKCLTYTVTETKIVYT